jgi:hypothetical protein
MKNRILVPADAPGPWQVPPELERHTPRQVRLTAGGRLLAALIVVLAMAAPVAGVWSWAAGENALRLRARIERDGVWADAVIASVRQDKGKQRRQSIAYEYRVGGRDYTGRARVRWFGPAEAGTRIAVRYLPENPQRSWVTGYEPGGPPLWLAGVVPVGMLLIAAACVYPLRKEQRLLAEGRAAEARVVAARKVNHGHGTRYRMEYEFRLLSGSVRRARQEMSRSLPAGAVVTVLYDPENPRCCAVYPFSLVRVA